MAGLFEVRVRPVDSCDAQDLLEIERNSFANPWGHGTFLFHFGDGGYPDGSGLECWRAIRTSDSTQSTIPWLFVAETTGEGRVLPFLPRIGILRWKPIGYVLLHQYWDDSSKFVAGIENICVLHGYRRSGVGRLLVNYAADFVDHDQMVVVIDEIDIDALKFFQALGFAAAGLFGEFVSSSGAVIDGVRMIRNDY